MPSRAEKLKGYLYWATQHPGSYGVVENPAKSEVYDPRREEIRAIQQGIYESLISREFDKPFFDKKGNRLDVKMELYNDLPMLKEIHKKAFSFTGPSAKVTASRLKQNDDGKWIPTEKCIKESKDRYHELEHVVTNRQDYEITLSLVRKAGFYRVVKEPTQDGPRYFVWPMKAGQYLPKGYRTAEEAAEVVEYQNKYYDPRKNHRWWVPLDKEYTATKLRHWLPPESIFKKKS